MARRLDSPDLRERRQFLRTERRAGQQATTARANQNDIGRHALRRQIHQCFARTSALTRNDVGIFEGRYNDRVALRSEARGHGIAIIAQPVKKMDGRALGTRFLDLGAWRVLRHQDRCSDP